MAAESLDVSRRAVMPHSHYLRTHTYEHARSCTDTRVYVVIEHVDLYGGVHTTRSHTRTTNVYARIRA